MATLRHLVRWPTPTVLPDHRKRQPCQHHQCPDRKVPSVSTMGIIIKTTTQSTQINEIIIQIRMTISRTQPKIMPTQGMVVIVSHRLALMTIYQHSLSLRNFVWKTTIILKNLILFFAMVDFLLSNLIVRMIFIEVLSIQYGVQLNMAIRN